MDKNKKTDSIKKDFEQKGFTVIKNFFPKKKINFIKKSLFEYVKKKQKYMKKREIHLAKKSDMINSIHNLKWPYVKKISRSKKILSISKKLLEGDVKSFGAEVFAKPAKVGRPVPIHQDNFYWNVDDAKGLTIWIALDKSTKKNGAIFYFEKSQRVGLINHTASNAPGSSQKIKNKNILKKFKKTTPELNEGDILIHHCLVAHGSRKNDSSDNRAGLTLRYIGKKSKINQKAKKKYELSLSKQMN